MEMHQVRYFLATVSELNFTKAAERCNVTQPSLTRAIKHLEDELGGDLFRRERPQAQLTELGQRMYPLLNNVTKARSELGRWLPPSRAAKSGRSSSHCRARSIWSC
jgi:DNA-binding transcriptional LysR family regulator